MPLSKSGIAVQILSSIQAQRQSPGLCTINDCKVVVNHLIRKFSEPLTRDLAHQRRQSRQVALGLTGDTVADHAVPVIVILERLLALPPEHLAINETNIERIETILTTALLLVEITAAEDAKLSKNGFQRRMPDTWTESGSPLARYDACGIEIQPITEAAPGRH